jgi:hypothetical protein
MAVCLGRTVARVNSAIDAPIRKGTGNSSSLLLALVTMTAATSMRPSTTKGYRRRKRSGTPITAAAALAVRSVYPLSVAPDRWSMFRKMNGGMAAVNATMVSLTGRNARSSTEVCTGIHSLPKLLCGIRSSPCAEFYMRVLLVQHD